MNKLTVTVAFTTMMLAACSDAGSTKATSGMVLAAWGYDLDGYRRIDEDSAVTKPALNQDGEPVLRDGNPIICIAAKQKGSNFDMSKAWKYGTIGMCPLSDEASEAQVLVTELYKDPETNQWKSGL